MGGCRCSFRSCDISTASMPGTHFFHFPVRFPERCRQWAELAEKIHFLELPNDKLKNKVVCQYHFKEKCFMNYKRDSLTKTAVPTLMVDGGVEFDIMVNTPTNEVPLEVDVVGPVVKKRPFSEVIKQEPAKKIRIITNERLLNSEIPPPPQEPEEPQFTVYNSDNFEPQQDIVTGSIVENGNKIVLKRNQVDLIDLVEDSFQKVINNQNTQIKDLKKTFDDTLKEVIGQTEEIKSRISEIKESSSTPSELKPEKSLNKVQLFNSVKRYLNPTMVTLLRMDMFGGSDREWKEDEKQFALELKELGDNVYDHMRDEWRFRLPSKKQLVEWASKEQSLKDEEDP